MTPMKLQTPEQLQVLSQRLPHWQVDAESATLTRQFVFDDFAQAFAFMAHMALHSERLNHHPEWHNVYNRVQVRLTTHDAQALTSLDEAWALAADAYCVTAHPTQQH